MARAMGGHERRVRLFPRVQRPVSGLRALLGARSYTSSAKGRNCGSDDHVAARCLRHPRVTFATAARQGLEDQRPFSPDDTRRILAQRMTFSDRLRDGGGWATRGWDRNPHICFFEITICRNCSSCECGRHLGVYFSYRRRRISGPRMG